MVLGIQPKRRSKGKNQNLRIKAFANVQKACKLRTDVHTSGDTRSQSGSSDQSASDTEPIPIPGGRTTTTPQLRSEFSRSPESYSGSESASSSSVESYVLVKALEASSPPIMGSTRIQSMSPTPSQSEGERDLSGHHSNAWWENQGPDVFGMSDKIRQEQLTMEESVRLGQQALNFQRENAQMLVGDLVTIESMDREAEIEKKHFEARLEQETKERRERGKLAFQQRRLLLDLEARQNKIRQLRHSYLKAAVLRKAMLAKRSLFNTKVSEREERQQQEIAEDQESAQRHLRNQRLLESMLMRYLPPEIREVKTREEQLLSQHMGETQRKETEQIRERQSLQTSYFVRVFELEMKHADEKHMIELEQARAVQELDSQLQMELWTEEAKVKMRAKEVELLEHFSVQRRRGNALQALQLDEKRNMILKQRQMRESRERRVKLELEQQYRDFMAQLKSGSLSASEDEHGPTIADSHTPTHSERERQQEEGTLAMDHDENEANQISQRRLQQQLAHMKSTITQYKRNQAKVRSELVEEHQELLANLVQRGQNLRKLAGEEMAEQLVSMKKIHQAETAVMQSAQKRELESFAKLISKEHELGKTATKFRAILSCMKDPVVISDENGVIETCNLAASKVFGYSEQEVVGQNVKILCNPLIRKVHQSYIEAFQRTGVGRIIGGMPRELYGQHKDGHLIPIALSVNLARVAVVTGMDIEQADMNSDVTDKRSLFIATMTEMAWLRQRETAASFGLRTMSRVADVLRYKRLAPDLTSLAEDGGRSGSSAYGGGRRDSLAYDSLENFSKSVPLVCSLDTFGVTEKMLADARMVQPGDNRSPPEPMDGMKEFLERFLLSQYATVDGAGRLVVPGIYVGSVGAALNVAWLRGTGITHLVCVDDVYNPFFTDYTSLVVRIADHPSERAIDRFPEVIAWIDGVLGFHSGDEKLTMGRTLAEAPTDDSIMFPEDNGANVLVYSMSGMSRAPAFVLAYLMQLKSTTYKECLRLLSNARPGVKLNSGFEQQMLEWETQVLAPAVVHSPKSQPMQTT